MQTHELLKLSEAELSPLLKTMSLTELELHIQQILEDLGARSYSNTMLDVMRLVQASGSSSDRFHRLQDYLRDTLPNKAMMSDLYARLAAMMMVFLVRKVSM